MANARRLTAERFWSKVRKTEKCWEWLACISNGYGRFGVNGRVKQAHVFAYELTIGPVPEGLELDHLCRNRRCVRPDHLEPVTRRVNLLRGNTIAAVHSAKTHCPQGHPYSGRNLAVIRQKYGSTRRCRQCDRERHAASRALRRCLRTNDDSPTNVNQGTFLPEDEQAE